MFPMGPEREPERDVIGTARADRGRRRLPRFAEAAGLVALAGLVAAVTLPSLGRHPAAPRPSATGPASPPASASPAPGPPAQRVPPREWAAALNVATWPVEQISAGPATGGVFALGVAGPQPWQLAARGTTRPGQGCVAEVTLDGGSAVPLRGTVPFPLPARPADRTAVGDLAFVTLSRTIRGVGIGFVQADRPGGLVWANPHLVGELIISVPVVTVTACGRQYYLAGFAYPLEGALDISAARDGSRPAEYLVPEWLTRPAVPGRWQATG